jgi:hypothetical protein
MSTEQNKVIARQVMGYLNQRNLDQVLKHYSSKAVFHGLPRVTEGKRSPPNLFLFDKNINPYLPVKTRPPHIAYERSVGNG